MPDKPEEMEKWMITSREHQDEKIRAMRQRGALFLAGAQDYFFIMRGEWIYQHASMWSKPWSTRFLRADSLRWADIPNLVIGRNGYDNWIMEYAYREKMDRIETTRTVRAIHQTAMDGNWVRREVFDSGHILSQPARRRPRFSSSLAGWQHLPPRQEVELGIWNVVRACRDHMVQL